MSYAGVIIFFGASQLSNFFLFYFIRGPIAQRLEQSAHNREVPGSIPGGPI